MPTLPTYSPRLVYQTQNGKVGVVYGGGYLSIEQAISESRPEFLPPELADAQLIGMMVVATTGIVKTIQLAGKKEKIALQKASNVIQTFSIIGVAVDIIDMQITPPAGTYMCTFESVTDDNNGRIGVIYEMAISQALTPLVLAPIPFTQRPVYVQRASLPQSTSMTYKITFDGTETLHITGTYSDPQLRGPSITTLTTRTLHLVKVD